MFYYLAIFGLKIYLNIIFKIKVNGKENIPKSGGVIFCSNHSSNFDPVIVCSNVNRKIHYFAKKELFDTKFKNYWMKQLCAFPVDREGTDINALKFSINLLKNGGALGIFAQGTRVKEGEEQVEAKSGVSLFALKSGAVVVPIGITSKYEKRGRVTVNIGKPISFEKYKNEKPKSDIIAVMTNEIMTEVEKLIEK
ncbi:MAG: 1-acyl-sn-glycerol-3-phosphate acyltransferase [Eubacteriales bacterium]|nr:1-acyl-sn-glycerol-3-phosphate acyltransferase [Eubacteriales bacterium]